MEVILLERIERLGQMGQVVKVRPGFARNFLLPQKKALRATKSNMEVFEKQRAQLEASNANERSKAEGVSKKMGNLTLSIIRQASETGQLYGSVSARDVADVAKEAGHTINRTQVQIDIPIKTLGLFPVKVKLHPEVTIKVTINVARSPEEAAVQLEKGAAVTKAMAERAEVEAAFGVPGAEGDEAAETKKPAKKAKTKKADADEAAAEEPAEPKASKPKAKKAAAKK
ncbi:MAG: 50S ribosomal protein L9 [Alphaproteobacteria bacterium]|nr:50S ribosomal protein L9 [Alphaproteobacteria bacterium]